jgi:hypothetical protein
VFFLQTVVRRAHGITLSDTEGGVLADAADGDMESILTRIAERLPLKRTAPGISLDPEFQHRLAIAEVVIDAKGLAAEGFQTKMRIVDEMMRAETKRAEQEAIFTGQGQYFDNLTNQLRGTGRNARQFFRSADRMRRIQRNRLRAAIPDRGRLDRIFAQLDALYLSYYKQAIEIL